MTGALIVGGAAFVGFVALFAIAAIGYLIYQNRGEIKEGAIELGKAVKSFVKDVIDKLPTIQARSDNFDRLVTNMSKTLKNVSPKSQEDDASKEYIKDLSDDIAILEMLQDQKKRSAIQELVNDGIIKKFSEEDMKRLLKKGLSTHIEDMEKPKDKKEPEKKGLIDLMTEFKLAIMAIGDNDIEKVREKVNKKVKEMKPSPEVKNPSPERVSGKGITGPS